MKIVVCTGGFDPAHSGHINYLNCAAKLGDILIVGLNSDEWLQKKKGRAFMPFEERASIIQNLKCVDQVLLLNDSDGTGADAIRQARKLYPNDDIIFANGGDRNTSNVPEQVIFADDSAVSFAFSVGGDEKQNSSRWILEDFKAAKTERKWGYYRVLHEVGKNVKVKELTVEPNQSLSMQKHFKRNELWFIAEGIASVYTIHNGRKYLNRKFEKNEYLRIFTEEWHQLVNEQSTPLKIIEIQYGDECDEEDIIRNHE